ncbi:MAG: hypothetical protein AABO41_21930 [Acidobacteriota bacterium]
MNSQLVELYKAVVLSDLKIGDKEKLLNELRKVMAPEENRWHFRIVIWTLALVALSIPIAVLWSLGKGSAVDVPPGLLSLGSAAVGALAAFLTPYARRREEETPESTLAPTTDLPTKLTKVPSSVPSVQTGRPQDGQSNEGTSGQSQDS